MPASHAEQKSKRCLRFSVRTMLIVLTLLAISIVGIQSYIEFQNSTPLELAVKKFNVRVMERYANAANSSWPLLTSDDVIEHLQSNDKMVTEAPPIYASIFQRIVKTKRVPKRLNFNVAPMSTVFQGSVVNSWSILMEMGTDDEIAKYRIEINTKNN